MQKQAAQIMFNEDQLCHLRPRLKHLNTLNVYQTHLYQNLNFMHRVKMVNIPEVFYETIKMPNHKYPTTFSNLNYSTIKRNTILDKRDKDIESQLL